MGRRGRKRQLDVEARYWQLLLSGIGTVQACRMVGITRKTGYRWRAENGGVPPTRIDEAARSNRYLSLMERKRIATLRGQRLGVREIARRIDRSPATVSRELRRNTRPHDKAYDGDLAHARARERTHRPRRSKLNLDDELRAFVQAKLDLEWSPEQVAQDLRRTHPGRPDWHICHETIYQALYHGGRGGLSRQLTKRLRTGRPLRRRRRRADQRRCRFLAPALLIDQRPAVVEDRVRIGDWEGDLIVGRMSQTAIGTLVDRTSRYLRLVHLPGGHRADQFRDALITVLDQLTEAARLPLTWDQGSEMAHHDQLAAYFRDGIYFARPASPWLRGTNENTNGLLRQYFPKGSSLGAHGPDMLRFVEDRLNHRPRKILGWCTPHDVFHSALAS
ncbi:IS30 family transposase [Plantactinospora solaniradicis]|uniref:IS30 family transposase n=1 Tax=Plantactinospora solaniradicis TaxID=1723736 RepID=A0ABW1KJS7_9ACTN